MKKKTITKRFASFLLTVAAVLQCFIFAVDASESTSSEYAASGYSAPITVLDDARPGDNDDSYIRVSGLETYASGITFAASDPDFTLDTEKTYRISVWLRSVPTVGGSADSAMTLNVRVGGGNPSGIFGWAGVNFNLKAATEINETWTEYYAIFKAAAAEEADIKFYRSSDATSVVPFDIDALTFTEVEKNENGEWVQVAGTTELVDEFAYTANPGHVAPSITKSPNTEFMRIARVDGTNTAFCHTDNKALTAGKYTVSGKFRLGEFDYGKLIYSTSPTYNVATNNNTAKLSVKAGNVAATSDFTMTNDWTECSFVLDIAEGTSLNDIVFSLDGAYTLDFCDITVLPLAVSEAVPADNLLTSGDFDSADVLASWNAGTQVMFHRSDANGGYLEANDIISATAGFIYDVSSVGIPAGTYKFTGYIRTAVYGEVSQKRIILTESSGKTHTIYANITNDWLKFEYYITLTSGLSQIKIVGGPYQEFIQAFCIDNFSIVPVSEIPSSNPNKFGTAVTPEEAFNSTKCIEITPWDENEDYEVNGLMINHDCSNFFSDVGRYSLDEEDYRNFALSFQGTHITDYVINVDGVFPAPGTGHTSALEYYYMTEFFDGQPVDFTGNSTAYSGYYMYEVVGSDYIGVWCETFPTVGVNPWLSFRMNDVHNYNDEGPAMSKSEFWYKNPQYRRVQHHSYVGYMDKAYDYTYLEVREYMLSYINAALNRYDCYGIELDYQRELNLFHIGGEYPGLDILNGFMRDVDDLVAVYEEKYGHEIKIGVRVAPDVQTNYDFGLDVITWAAEGIVQLVSPSGRYESHCTDMPIRIWDSMLSPYDVTLAPGIDFTYLRSYGHAPTAGGNTIETLAATAAYMYSQGADKMYTYNYFPSFNTVFEEKDKVNSTSAGMPINGSQGMWNVLTTLGSYEKVNTYNRRCVLTYNDKHPVWRDYGAQLPEWVQDGSTSTLRIPVGDILDGSVLTVKFSTRDDAIAENPPTVYVNGWLCTYDGMERCVGGHTEYNLLCYKIPRAAYGSCDMIIEITSEEYIRIDYAEVYVKAPNN
ncbi:MAG: hypothetical protein IJY93_07775 [Clostridia bacterium]|nr:hypothetical protein [Clostridia bacterium]